MSFMALSLGIGFVVNFGTGWIGEVLTIPYLLVAVLYTMIGAALLQFYFDHWENDYQVGIFFDKQTV